MDKYKEQLIYKDMYLLLYNTIVEAIKTLRYARLNTDKIYLKAEMNKKKNVADTPDYNNRYYILFEVLSVIIKNFQIAQQKTEKMFMLANEVDEELEEERKTE